MIWQNLWALAGLTLIALPILIHLLSRRRAVRQKFPSLRFLNVTRLLPTRSPVLSDLLLLMARIGVVAAAAIALAQPLWVSATRRQTLNTTLARVIVIDTSRTMTHRATNGVAPADSARTLAAQLATTATTSITLQTLRPADALAGATAWLATQAGRGEVAFISDFQTGAIDSAAFAQIPARFGVQLVRLGGASPELFDTLATLRTRVVAAPDSRQTVADWMLAPDTASSATGIVFDVADNERSALNAARQAAALAVSNGLADTAMPVAIVFPGAPGDARARAVASAPASAWMGNTLLAVNTNSMLRSAMQDAAVTDTVVQPPFVTVARNVHGAPVVFAAQDTQQGVSRLVFFPRTAPANLGSAALIAAVSASIGVPSTLAESQRDFLSDASIASLQRKPAAVDLNADSSAATVAADSGLSDGRWPWLLALVLLGLEWYLRRRAAQTATYAEHELVSTTASQNRNITTAGGAL